MATTQTGTNTAEGQARAQLESIMEMVKALNDAQDQHEDGRAEEARETIQEDAFSVGIRSGWYSPGHDHEPEEYQILLCGGGPAVRIIGALGSYGEPDSAELQYQDWGTPWTEYPTDTNEEQALLDYARVFYFGS